MIHRYNLQKNDTQENVFWITMSDLLLGLAVIFIVLFVLAMTGFAQAKLKEQALKSDIAKSLAQDLQQNNINAQVDLTTGVVKLSDLQLFEVGSWELSPKGKEFLNKFIPVYLKAVFSNDKISSKVENIIIQGHTDSQLFSGVSSKEIQFSKNMELSAKRANEVAKYIFYTPYNKAYSKKLFKMLVVEGKSFSDPVIINGKEDFDKSRRVELKLVVKSSNLQDFMGISQNELGK